MTGHRSLSVYLCGGLSDSVGMEAVVGLGSLLATPEVPGNQPLPCFLKLPLQFLETEVL